MIAAPHEEAPTVAATTRGPKAENSNPHCLTIDIECKAFATLQAEFALLGHSLFRNTPTDRPGWFTVTRWGMARDLRSLDDVRGFLRQIGGSA
jgi:hypothetical protein